MFSLLEKKKKTASVETFYICGIPMPSSSKNEVT